MWRIEPNFGVNNKEIARATMQNNTWVVMDAKGWERKVQLDFFFFLKGCYGLGAT